MTNWPIKTLGDVCEVIAGQSPEGKYYSKDGQGTPFYQGKKEFGERLIGPAETWTSVVTKMAKEGDILMSVRAPVGPVNICVGEVCIGRGLASIRPRKELDRDFLFYLLRALEPEISGTQGAIFASINKSQIAAIEIPVPPLTEQKRIVSLLDKVTARVTELTACYEQARTHSNNLFTSALRDALGSDADWPVKTLDDLCRIEMGRTPSRGDNRGWDKDRKTSNHWASIADISACDGRILSSTKERISDVAARTTKVVPAGTLMMSFKLSIGKLAFAGCDLYTNEAIVAFHLPANSSVNSEFLYWSLMVVDWAALTQGSEKVKGATMNKAKLSVLEIPVPPLEEQKHIVMRLDEMRAKTSEMMAIYDAKLQTTKNLRQSILEAAFGGRL